MLGRREREVLLSRSHQGSQKNRTGLGEPEKKCTPYAPRVVLAGERGSERYRWFGWTSTEDRLNPNVRTRICVQECNNAAAPLSPEKLFSAMLPLNALKILTWLKTSRSVSKTGEVLLIAHFDISRSHSRPHRSQRLCGALREVLFCGTQDASSLWQKDHTGPHADPSAVLLCDKLAARLPVRGDDFVMLGDAAAVTGLMAVGLEFGIDFS